jgi:insulysin
MEQPYQHALYFHDICLQHNRFHNDELFDAVKKASFEDVLSHSVKLFSSGHLELLVHGNHSQDEAREIGSMLREGFAFQNLYPSQFPERRVVSLPAGADFCFAQKVYNLEDINSAILMSFQIGEETVRNRVLADLFAQIASEPCYSKLRTEEQLGYIVAGGVDSQRGVVCFRVIIQSSHKSPPFLESRIENFLKEFQV